MEAEIADFKGTGLPQCFFAKFRSHFMVHLMDPQSKLRVGSPAAVYVVKMLKINRKGWYVAKTLFTTL